MELILICLLTIIALIVGIFIGKAWGEDLAYSIGEDAGYEAGFTDGLKNSNNDNVDNFPKSLDGKFFSREMAIKQMSMKEGD